MSDEDDIIRRRRRQREANARRRAWLAGGVAAAVVGFGVCAGAVALIRPRGGAVVAIAPIGEVVAVRGAGTADEPTEAEWKDVLDHPWWKGKIEKREVERLVTELSSARVVTVFFNREGKSVITRDDKAITLNNDRDWHDRQAVRRQQLVRADVQLSLVKSLGEFRAASMSSGLGERASRLSALNAIWDALKNQPFTAAHRSP